MDRNLSEMVVLEGHLRLDFGRSLTRVGDSLMLAQLRELFAPWILTVNPDATSGWYDQGLWRFSGIHSTSTTSRRLERKQWEIEL